MLDIIIIGSGPAGLSAAIYAARSQFDFVVAEKDYLGTGQIALSDEVDNYPGLPGIKGIELGVRLRSHAEALGSRFYEGEAVSITDNSGIYSVHFSDGSTLESRSIILCTGASHRRLDVPGSGLAGVSYCAACDGAFYRNRTAAVVGGGDTALSEALYLSEIAGKVILIHRREQFRANRTLQEKVRSVPSIEVLLNASLLEITGSQRVSGISIMQSGKRKHIEADGVFAAIGIIPNTSAFGDIVRLDEKGFIIAGENGITSSKGIFAAGDVRTKQFRQVATAVSDGANCVESAEKYLRQ